MVPQIDPILEGKLFQAVGPEVESKVRKNGETELREPPLLYYKKVGLEAIVLTGFWREDGDLIGRDLYEPGVLIIPGKNKTEQLLRIEQLLNDTTFPKRLKEHTLKPAFEELKFKDRGKPKDIIRFVLRGNPGVDGDLGFVVVWSIAQNYLKTKVIPGSLPLKVLLIQKTLEVGTKNIASSPPLVSPLI